MKRWRRDWSNTYKILTVAPVIFKKLEGTQYEMKTNTKELTITVSSKKKTITVPIMSIKKTWRRMTEQFQDLNKDTQ